MKLQASKRTVGWERIGPRMSPGASKVLFRLLFVMAAILAGLPSKADSEAERRYERQFADAVRAYDENRLRDAIAGWEALRRDGQILPEVLFNLGNAYYRIGQLGPAIRTYREAQYLAPRDPDIRANLGFAAQTAGISLPVRHPLQRVLLNFTRAEWLAVASASFWLLAVVVGLGLWRRRWQDFLRLPMVLWALALAAAAAGLWAHHYRQRFPEFVLMKPGQNILSGPLESATALMSIPEGAIVEKISGRGGWLEIRYDSVRGWLPAASVAPVVSAGRERASQ